ncbi:MAG: ATP-binding protein [Gammaproteobacteria bacterium]
MYQRHIQSVLKKYAKQYPIVTLNGPRQSGKSTLSQETFPKYRYVSLEDPDMREFAMLDPRSFLETYDEQVIIDEIQHVPHLFSYLQTHVDRQKKTGQFILTGSQQFLLNAKISQSLAGRTAILRLLPLSLSELLFNPPQTYWQTGKLSDIPQPIESLYYYLWHGFYPRLNQNNLDPSQFFRDYFETYITKDITSLLNVGDLQKFQLFLRAIAARCGQRVNLSSLGNDLGLSHTTISRWLSVLEASFIIYLLPPHFKNFNKRLIKSPKIYFLDSGLLCYLLRIKNLEELQTHALIGGIFESFVVSEIFKSFYNTGSEAPLYFWQDSTGDEIDLLIDRGKSLFPIEIKASQTLAQHFFTNLQKWLDLPKNPQKEGCLIYAGKTKQKRQNITVIPWYLL